MTLRRGIALLLLLTVAVSSAEVLLAPDESPVASEIVPSPAHGAFHASAPADSAIPDDCTCLCACGCVNAQLVVSLEPVVFFVTGVELMRDIAAPAVVVNRARARPDLRPPLA